MFILDVVPLQIIWPIVSAQNVAAAVETPDPAFLARGDIHGIDISPPADNWDAKSYGMTPRRLAAMHEAGFDTHRVFLSLEEFLDPPVSLDATVDKWTAYIAKSVDAGFRVFVSFGSYAQNRSTTVVNPVARSQFHKGLKLLCTRLASQFTEEQVALEMSNEPTGEAESPGYYHTAAPQWFRLCRSKAPKMTLIFQAESGYHDALSNFNLKDFDANTMFSFHPYSPGEFTHQGIGNQPYLYNVPMPITRYAGGLDKMIADVFYRISQDTKLTAAQKEAERERYKGFLTYFLWANDGSKWEDWTVFKAWIAQTGINPKRIVAGEFGVVSEFNYNGTPAMRDVASRAHFMRKITAQVKANNFGGWVVHQALGDFNLFEQTSVSDQGEVLIPELVDALFGTDALPAGPAVRSTDTHTTQ